MNLPNYLTILRIVLSFLCVIFILRFDLLSFCLAFMMFICASLTDFFDGFIARKYGKVSDLGKLLDPIADKILVLGVFLAFLVLDIVNIWMVIVIMMREFIITGVRLFVLSRGRVLEAKRFGKHKTFSQMVGINYIFIVVILSKILKDNAIVGFLYEKGIPLLMWYVVVVTAFSGVHYLWANRRIIKNF